MPVDEDLISREVDVLVKGLGLPPCPDVLTRILDEAHEDEPDFPRIAQLISRDASLAAAMLRVVNSAAFGLSQKISSVQSALLVVGVRNAAALVTGLALKQAFPAGNSTLLTRFWAASSRAAALAGLVAQETGGVARYLAHTYALFRDCGVVALASRNKEYADTRSSLPLADAQSIAELERQRFGIDHATIGFVLAGDWGLPEEVRWAIRHHHAFTPAGQPATAVQTLGRRFIAVGLAADWLAATLDRQPFPDWPDAAPFVAEVIGCDTRKLESLVAQAGKAESSA